MHLASTRIIDDAYYGELKICLSAERGVVEVSGEQIPTVIIERSSDAELNKFVPIGTREAAHLTVSVDGIEDDLRLGPGKLTRGSYRVELTFAGAHYKFMPDSADATQLWRDGAKIASFSLDDADGTFVVHWQTDRDDSQPADAALGYALSAAFRTGATGIFSLLLNGSENVPWH
jgi:hypothetical protein